MHLHTLPHQHTPINYTLLGMSIGVILVPPAVLTLLFLIAHLV